jgi:hypothetical protein
LHESSSTRTGVGQARRDRRAARAWPRLRDRRVASAAAVARAGATSPPTAHLRAEERTRHAVVPWRRPRPPPARTGAWRARRGRRAGRRRRRNPDRPPTVAWHRAPPRDEPRAPAQSTSGAARAQARAREPDGRAATDWPRTDARTRLAVAPGAALAPSRQVRAAPKRTSSAARAKLARARESGGRAVAAGPRELAGAPCPPGRSRARPRVRVQRAARAAPVARTGAASWSPVPSATGAPARGRENAPRGCSLTRVAAKTTSSAARAPLARARESGGRAGAGRALRSPGHGEPDAQAFDGELEAAQGLMTPTAYVGPARLPAAYVHPPRLPRR